VSKPQTARKSVQKEYPWDKALTRIITWIYSQWKSIDARLNANKTPIKNKGKAPALSTHPVANPKLTAELVIQY
jgi:hypothetical protein